jgi:hypothetical protein
MVSDLPQFSLMEYQNPQLNEYYQREAQLYYQRQAMQGQFSPPPAPKYTASYSYWDAIKTSLRPWDDLQSGEYRTHAARKGAAAKAFTEKSTQIGAVLGDVTASTTIETMLAWGGWGLGGFTGSMLLPMAGGMAYDKTKSFLGLDQAASQFSRINDLQMASAEFGAGHTSNDPYGKRMGRGQSKQMNDFLEDYARATKAYTGLDISSDDLRNEVADLSEAKLLESVTDADDFARKFTSLKNAVSKISEALGKSFKEGTEVLGQLRKVNVNAFEGQSIVESVRQLGTQAGLDFDTTFAAGMEGAYMGRQVGLSAAAGIRVGAQAAANATTMYEKGVLDDDLLFRIGGEEGLRNRLMQAPMQMTQNSFMDIMLRDAYKTGDLDVERLGQFMTGEASFEDADLSGGMEGYMKFQANRGKIYSEINEMDPRMMNQMYFSGMMGLAQKSLGGRPVDENTLLATMAALDPTMDQDTLRLMLEELKGMRSQMARSDREAQMTGLGRAQDLMTRGGIFRSIAEDYRASKFNGFMTDMGMEITDNVRDAVFGETSRVSREWKYLTTGVYDTGLTTGGIEMSSHDFRSGRFGNKFFTGSDGVDMFDDMLEAGIIDKSAVYDAGFGPGRIENGQYVQNFDPITNEVMGNKEDFDRLAMQWGLEPGALDAYVGKRTPLTKVGEDMNLTFMTGSGGRDGLSVRLPKRVVVHNDALDAAVSDMEVTAAFHAEIAMLNPAKAEFSLKRDETVAAAMRMFGGLKSDKILSLLEEDYVAGPIIAAARRSAGAINSDQIIDAIAKDPIAGPILAAMQQSPPAMSSDQILDAIAKHPIAGPVLAAQQQATPAMSSDQTVKELTNDPITGPIIAAIRQSAPAMSPDQLVDTLANDPVAGPIIAAMRKSAPKVGPNQILDALTNDPIAGPIIAAARQAAPAMNSDQVVNALVNDPVAGPIIAAARQATPAMSSDQIIKALAADPVAAPILAAARRSAPAVDSDSLVQALSTNPALSQKVQGMQQATPAMTSDQIIDAIAKDPAAGPILAAARQAASATDSDTLVRSLMANPALSRRIQTMQQQGMDADTMVEALSANPMLAARIEVLRGIDGDELRTILAHPETSGPVLAKKLKGMWDDVTTGLDLSEDEYNMGYASLIQNIGVRFPQAVEALGNLDTINHIGKVSGEDLRTADKVFNEAREILLKKMAPGEDSEWGVRMIGGIPLPVSYGASDDHEALENFLENTDNMQMAVTLADEYSHSGAESMDSFMASRGSDDREKLEALSGLLVPLGMTLDQFKDTVPEMLGPGMWEETIEAAAKKAKAEKDPGEGRIDRAVSEGNKASEQRMLNALDTILENFGTMTTKFETAADSIIKEHSPWWGPQH